MPDHDLVLRPATELVALLLRRELSARELLDAHLAQIDRVNPAVNAIVTLAVDHARRLAARADDAIVAGTPLGPLHGLPVVHKDLVETKGIRTTYGSPIYAEHVPEFDALVVERLVGAGAITVGKTNTPEWGTGSQTHNRVFGATRNPYDPSTTCGGSSGGAAVALATGMASLADGTDMGGSLRNPASFCNVVGLRPTTGRVPNWPNPASGFSLATAGPMGRTAGDVALQMQVLSRPDHRHPMSQTNSPEEFVEPLDRDFRDTVVAWSDDLGGLPVDARVTRAMAPAREVLAALGCTVRNRDPDMTGAEDAFRTWRAWYYALTLGETLRTSPHELGESAAWNTRIGLDLTDDDLARAERARTALAHRMREFLAEHEFLITLVSQVPPFAVELAYPTEVASMPTESYLDWMRACYWITATGLPAASVPFGFTDDGLPVGLQVVGRTGDDVGVLQLAQAIETATGTWRHIPDIARSDRSPSHPPASSIGPG